MPASACKEHGEKGKKACAMRSLGKNLKSKLFWRKGARGGRRGIKMKRTANGNGEGNQLKDLAIVLHRFQLIQDLLK
jgi:hypothetical protein